MSNAFWQLDEARPAHVRLPDRISPSASSRLLAVELALQMQKSPTLMAWKLILAGPFFLAAAFFIYRSFYGMRIEMKNKPAEQAKEPQGAAVEAA